MNHALDSAVYEVEFQDWKLSLPQLLEQAQLKPHLSGVKQILLKPNLVSLDPPPITTPVELVEAIYHYLQPLNIPILIGEGTASADHSTHDVFDYLGYTALSQRLQIPLIDLNEEPLVELQLPNALRWPRMHLPKIALESFLISIPQLKAHSMSGVTLSLKNMMGLAPPKHYQQGGHWKKSAFHQDMDRAIFELNRYRKADFTILDATVGMAQAHLWGPTCNPPVNRLVAGWDPVKVDQRGCALLGKDWRHIGHLRLAAQFGLG